METADILIRGLPENVVVTLNARAVRLGLSVGEYVRRRLIQDVAGDDSPVDAVHLARFAETFGDLGNREVMSRAWR